MKDIVPTLASLIGDEQRVSGPTKPITREKTELKIKCLEKVLFSLFYTNIQMDIGLKDSTSLVLGNDYLFVGTHEGIVLAWDIQV